VHCLLHTQSAAVAAHGVVPEVGKHKQSVSEVPPQVSDSTAGLVQAQVPPVAVSSVSHDEPVSSVQVQPVGTSVAVHESVSAGHVSVGHDLGQEQ